MPPLSLYLHFPFCIRKCPYCDFASQPVAAVPEARYVQALLRELDHWRQTLAEDDRALRSIYLGGGTPSLFSASAMATLLTAIRQQWPCHPACEITVEVNPESANLDRLTGYRQAGINRISLGVQALDEGRLRLLARPHDTAAALHAVDLARQAGFANISLDLIFATPGHSLALWEKELDVALTLDIQHISCYALTLEPGTRFHSQWQQGRFHPLSEEEEWSLFHAMRQRLAQAGMPAYEISNFARPGFACQHNALIWHFGDYLGVGAGAHGKITARNGTIRRTAHGPDPLVYMQQPCQGIDTPLSPAEAAMEWLIMGLRTTQGVERAACPYGETLGFWSPREQTLHDLIQDGWLAGDGHRIFLTERGVAMANQVMVKLM